MKIFAESISGRENLFLFCSQSVNVLRGAFFKEKPLFGSPNIVYSSHVTSSFTGRGWLPVCLIGLIGMLNSKTLKLSSQQSLQLPSSWTPTQYLHYRSAIWVTLCVFTQMPVMLTLNLKKHDSSQFISEIQYGKDFVGFYSTKDKTNLCLVAIRYQR